MNKPALLLRQMRENLVETEFYGFIVFCDKEKNIKTYGNPQNYPFFQRSCAKPLQASLAFELDTIGCFNLSDEELAISCASHTGEKIHIDVLKGMLEKGGLKESDLSCPVIQPLNNFDGIKEFSPLHNNCSGKHALMLLICQQMGWDIKNYLDINHPLQIMIYEKIKSLCEEKNKLPKTLDGCTAPNFATSLEGLSKGFLNLYIQYPKLCNAMPNHPYICGGKNRLDTHIMQLSPYLSAKVGANGLCAVVNTNTLESFSVKVADANMKARTLIVLEILRQKNWIDENSINKNLLNEFFDAGVYTETGVRIGEYEPQFDLSGLV